MQTSRKVVGYFPEEIEEVFFCYFLLLLLLSVHFFFISSSLKFVFYLDFVIPLSCPRFPFIPFVVFFDSYLFLIIGPISLSLSLSHRTVWIGLFFFSLYLHCPGFNLETQERKAVEFNSTLIAVLSKDFRRL